MIQWIKFPTNDMADAEAIVIAARQPEIRFVTPKTEEQQLRATLFRGRERLVRQRTDLVNALRSCRTGRLGMQGSAETDCREDGKDHRENGSFEHNG